MEILDKVRTVYQTKDGSIQINHFRTDVKCRESSFDTAQWHGTLEIAKEFLSKRVFEKINSLRGILSDEEENLRCIKAGIYVDIKNVKR